MDIKLLGFIPIFLSSLIHIAEGEYSPTQETAIRNLIFRTNNYDYVSRPPNQTTITVNQAMIAIDELDIVGQSLTGAVWIAVEWNDTRLSWTPASFDDIEEIVQEQSKIWKPQLVIGNNIGEVNEITDPHLFLQINYEGKIKWELPLFYKVHCEVNTGFFPFDNHTCSINVTSMRYSHEEVHLMAKSTEIYLPNIRNSGQWRVTTAIVVSENLTTQSDRFIKYHPQVQFEIYLKRRSSFYHLSMTIPIFCTSILVALVFKVPEESGEKLSYALTIFLSVTVLVTSFTDYVPPTSDDTPVLGFCLGLLLVNSGIAAMCTVGIKVLANRDVPVERCFWLNFTRVILGVCTYLHIGQCGSKIRWHVLCSPIFIYTVRNRSFSHALKPKG